MRLLALVLALSVASSGCLVYDYDQEVCVSFTVSYEGSAQGPILATLVSQEGTMGYTSVHSSEAEIRPLLSGEQNISRCSPRSEHREEVAVVKVWMDVDGSGLECMETAGKATACTPAPTAPQATHELTLPAYGRMAAPFHLTLMDP
ncbi:hypothetical protein ACN28I_06275 [Archangium gephyra]|uniref:hypothetical protein n=1 Tax=Archangium gephyra TaxID=48 RepID=UPI003B81A257